MKNRICMKKLSVKKRGDFSCQEATCRLAAVFGKGPDGRVLLPEGFQIILGNVNGDIISAVILVRSVPGASYRPGNGGFQDGLYPVRIAYADVRFRGIPLCFFPGLIVPESDERHGPLGRRGFCPQVVGLQEADGCLIGGIDLIVLGGPDVACLIPLLQREGPDGEFLVGQGIAVAGQ